MLRACDATTGAVIAERLRPAHTHWTRLKGLLGTRTLPPGDGLWIKPCRQVHMFGMRYAIDVVFLDAAQQVVHTVEALAPGKISPKVAAAASVLELPAGTVARVGLKSGAHIDIDSATPAAPRQVGARRFWLRGGAWVFGFILATMCLVQVNRDAWFWKGLCPEYLQFWAAGSLLAAGDSPYDLDRLGAIERAYGWDKTKNGLGVYETMPFHYPPSVLSLILALLVPLGFAAARMTWLMVNVELLVLSGYLLRTAAAGVWRVVPILVVPLFALSVLALLVGQVTPLILFMTVAAWRLLQHGWDRAAGCVLACGAIKPQITFLVLLATVLWLARQERWRALAMFVGAGLLSLLVSLWAIPGWPMQIAHNLAHMPMAMGTDRFPWWGTTWLLALRSLGLSGAELWVLYLVVAVPFTWEVLRCALRRDTEVGDVIAVSVVATFFVTPTARIYDLPLLLIPFVMLLGKRMPGVTGAAVLAVLIVVPYVQLFFLGAREGVPVHVWFFWIPMLLALWWLRDGWKPALVPRVAQASVW